MLSVATAVAFDNFHVVSSAEWEKKSCLATCICRTLLHHKSVLAQSTWLSALTVLTARSLPALTAAYHTLCLLPVWLSALTAALPALIPLLNQHHGAGLRWHTDQGRGRGTSALPCMCRRVAWQAYPWVFLLKVVGRTAQA